MHHPRIDKVAVMPKFGAMAAGILIEPGISFGTETMNSLGHCRTKPVMEHIRAL